MPELLFLHDLDAAVSVQPAVVSHDLPAVPPCVLVTPGCGHPPICTLVVDAAAGALRVQCVVCGALVAVAVGDHTEEPAPAPHGEQRAVLYSEGRPGGLLCRVRHTPGRLARGALCAGVEDGTKKSTLAVLARLVKVLMPAQVALTGRP
jgi:hypothetical protein